MDYLGWYIVSLQVTTLTVLLATLTNSYISAWLDRHEEHFDPEDYRFTLPSAIYMMLFCLLPVMNIISAVASLGNLVLVCMELHLTMATADPKEPEQ